MVDMLLIVGSVLSGADVPEKDRQVIYNRVEAHVGDPVDLPASAWQSIAFAAKMEFSKQCRKHKRANRSVAAQRGGNDERT